MDFRNKPAKTLLSLAFVIHLASAATHSLQYFYTGVTPGINFPEFTAVGQVDDEQFMKYDSNIRRCDPKTKWMNKVADEDRDYWYSETQISQKNQEIFKASLPTAMVRFNHTKGVHTVQMMYGCELHDDGTKRGYIQYGYDGEDFISLDLNTLTWTAANPQAVITKHKWEITASGDLAVQTKNYLENICTEWLQKYVGYGRDTLDRKVPPQVFLFQKDSSSPVVCHVTGFFPRGVTISWQKNGRDLNKNVELTETLPNEDGTFQKSSILRVSPEKLNKNEYTCVVEHSSLEEDVELHVKDRRDVSVKNHTVTVPTETSNCCSVRLLVTITVVPLALIVSVLIICLKKKPGDRKH